MAEELEKTCENCEYECEDMEGTHCRHCIHNAEEQFKPKINHEKEIRAKAIDEFCNEIVAEYDNDATPNVSDYLDYTISIRDLFRIAEELKGVQE